MYPYVYSVSDSDTAITLRVPRLQLEVNCLLQHSARKRGGLILQHTRGHTVNTQLKDLDRVSFILLYKTFI